MYIPLGLFNIPLGLFKKPKSFIVLNRFELQQKKWIPLSCL